MSKPRKTVEPIRREVLEEAARRAGWNATKGPKHLRKGQFRPEGHPPYTSSVVSGAGT